MMKTLKKLVESKRTYGTGNHTVLYIHGEHSYFTGRGRRVDTWGNVTCYGEVKRVNGFTRAFTYLGNTICIVDDVNHLVILTNAGWNTPSTTRALNDYRRYFVDERGYEIVDED